MPARRCRDRSGSGDHFVKPGTINPIPYNHYNYLRTIESIFGLKYLGYANRPEVTNFGRDVFNNPKGK